MAQFKVGDKVRLVKARNVGAYDDADFDNSWLPEMTARVERKEEGVIECIGDTGIRIVGWSFRYPPDSFELVEPPIDWTKPVQTRDGTPVNILSREGRGTFPVIGYIGDATDVDTWTAEGKYRTNKSGPEDLMNVPEAPKQREVWLNVFKNSRGELTTGISYGSRENANFSGVADKRVGCIKVVLTEGQFDN